MSDDSINSLADLDSLRSAPELSLEKQSALKEELKTAMSGSEWFTLGIMAESLDVALNVTRQIEKQFNWAHMDLIDSPTNLGPVFLKANQKNGQIYVRIEHGLGEGILITGHPKDPGETGPTWGPLPLSIFNS